MSEKDFNTIVDEFFKNVLNIDPGMDETISNLRKSFTDDFESLTNGSDLRLGAGITQGKIAPLEDSLRYINK